MVTLLLGGWDPDEFKENGINCGLLLHVSGIELDTFAIIEKLVANSSDPGLLLAAAKKLFSPDMKKKLESGEESIGLDAKLMVNVDLKVNTLIE